jgi:succinate dehydrogenase flavin-adding protein (antitoxin of CptAB toxin-antitoxin module)
MLELDYLLQNFLDTQYECLSPDDLQAFQKLLETPDTLLLEYLMERTVPVDPGFCDVIQKIRAAITH